MTDGTLLSHGVAGFGLGLRNLVARVSCLSWIGMSGDGHLANVIWAHRWYGDVRGVVEDVSVCDGHVLTNLTGANFSM